MSAPIPKEFGPPRTVYLSYATESEEGLGDLRQRLSGVGVRVIRDTATEAEAKERLMRSADFMLVICCFTFTKRFEAVRNDQEATDRDGIEASLITRLLNEPDQRGKIVPVIIAEKERQWIPEILRSKQYIDLSSEQGYELLFRLLKEGTVEQTGAGTEKAQNAANKGAGEARKKEQTQSPTEGGSTFGFEEFDQAEFTQYAWDILETARRLREEEPVECSVRRVLATLMFSGFEDQEGAYTGGWLLRQLPEELKIVRQRLGEMYPPLENENWARAQESLRERGGVETMTSHLKATLDLARRLAREGSARRNEPLRISARHILGAALVRSEQPSSVDWLLGRMGSNATEIRLRMLEELPRWGVEDDVEVWSRLLDTVPKGPELRDVPNYAADSALGPDLIGITREVEAMASLVSAWNVEPPLSIGLFGEWGSGKSFFMQKMKERVRQIASEARKSQRGQKDFGYYKNIVQVEFNAWHYVEGNLWASLVEHIFSNLRLEGIGEENVDSEEYIRARLEKLLTEVKDKSAEAVRREQKAEELRLEAEKKQEEAEKKAVDLEREAQEALERSKAAEREGQSAAQNALEKQREADEAEVERNRLSLRNIFDEVAGSATIRNLVAQDLESLGISKERIETVEGLRDSLKEASESATVLQQGLKIFTEDKQKSRLLLWLLAAPATAVILGFSVRWLASQQNEPWLQSVGAAVSAVTGVAAVVVGFWKRYSPHLKPALDVVARLKEHRKKLEEEIEKTRKERAKKIAAMDEEVIKKQREAAEEKRKAEEKTALAKRVMQEANEKKDEALRAKVAAQAARVEAERLRQEAEALLPDRRIAAFIQDRAGAKDYRRHLGVPALIRRDFEKLSAMFRSQRIEEEKGKDGLASDGKEENGRNDLAIVNRIILYIDDLDRCPPEKVVEVLRAIHLLLAFPLFVVVVAVDARWMKRSLRDRFSLMLDSQAHERKPEEGNGRAQEKAFDLTVTADDYLEKIFQVPFWIRPLSRGGCKNLVAALTSADSRAAGGVGKEQERSGEEKGARDQKQDLKVGERKGEIGAGKQKEETPRSGEKKSGEDKEAAPVRVFEEFQARPVEPQPKTLQLTKEELEFMTDLAPIVGRSPRSVKRFVNCYRLLKSALDGEELARATRDGTFRTTMLLLGIVTGLPDIAPSVLADLRRMDRKINPGEWAKDVAGRLKLTERAQWNDVMLLMDELKETAKLSTIRPLARAADLVDRFTFSPTRSAVTGI